MKNTVSWRWLEKGLLIAISLLLIFSGVVLILRPLLIPAGSGVSPAKTVGTGKITADGFTTVFRLAENAAQAAQDYQDHLLLVVLLLAAGIIGLLYAGALFIYSLIFKLKLKRVLYRVAVGAVFAMWVGMGILNLLNGVDAPHVSDCVPLQSIYDAHQSKITEGIVHVSHTQPAGGHDKGDILTVGNVKFEVSYYVSTCAYKQSIAHGGALTEGTDARIYYADYRTILRIDVKKQ
jgi:hypothetical protein